jgi:excisionase family DNA binding protein
MTTPRRSFLPSQTTSFLSADQVAALLDLSPRTVRRWIEDGRLQAIRTSTRRGRYRIPREALADFLERARATCAEDAALAGPEFVDDDARAACSRREKDSSP